MVQVTAVLADEKRRLMGDFDSLQLTPRGYEPGTRAMLRDPDGEVVAALDATRHLGLPRAARLRPLEIGLTDEGDPVPVVAIDMVRPSRRPLELGRFSRVTITPANPHGELDLVVRGDGLVIAEIRLDHAFRIARGGPVPYTDLVFGRGA